MEDKQKCIIPNLEIMKELMVARQHFDDAGVISETLKYIRSFSADLDRHVRTNKELTATIRVLADQADTKKNNLLNFHSANILQGKLIGGSTFDNEIIVNQSIKLAKLMIERLEDEGE